MKHIISLGAGVQSSTMALMAAVGEIEPMPDCAIFADTGAEPDLVYRYLDEIEKLLPFPVYRVMHKTGLKDAVVNLSNGKRFATPPFHTESEKADGGILRRQCTAEYKIQPIQKKIRSLLGYKRGQRIKGVQGTIWIGISMDEIVRMKPNREKWLENRHPLIEQRMSRYQCLQWMEKNNFPMPSKSSCTFCPYHDNGHWREMKMNDPKSWNEAVAIDELIREGKEKTTQKLYLHKSLKPLREVDFRNLEDFGQMTMFDNECEGMCGV